MLVGSRDPAAWMVALFFVVTTARFVHAAALLTTGDMGKPTVLRHLGSARTYFGGVALAVAALLAI